jgi:hypothetical protein
VDFAQRVAGLTSEKVYSAIQWDPVWQTGLNEIGWEDRFLGLMRKPVASFSSAAIPFHRVVVTYCLFFFPVFFFSCFFL